MTAKGSTLPGMAAVFVFLTAFAAYAWTASPAMGWLDSPELVAASACLGVPHSPGHPLAALLGKLAALVPLGDVALRVSLLSSLCAAGAAAALCMVCSRVVAASAPALPGRVRGALAAAVALVFALSWAVWFQAVRAEVYGLTGVFAAALVAAVVAPGPDARRWTAAGLWAGLALATHHFIALTVVLPAIAVALVERARMRTLVLAASLGIVGMAAFLYLPVRAAQHPTVSWGAPHTAERFAWTVSARAFHKAVDGSAVSTPGLDAAKATASLAEQMSWPLALIALLGLYLGLRNTTWRRSALFFGAIAALCITGRAVIGFDPETPDHQGYLVPALGALLALAAAGVAALAQELADARPAWGRGVHALAIAGLAVLAGLQLARTADEASLARERASDELARWELERLPPRTLLLPAYFETSFRLWALRAVEQARPDVAILDRSFLTYPGMADEARREHPDLAALIDAPLSAGALTPIDMLAGLAASRPVLVQLHPNLEPAVDPWLTPVGAFARLHPAPPDASLRAQAEAQDARERALVLARATGGRGLDALPLGDRRGLRNALLWHDFVRLSLYCRQGRLSAARAALDDALALAPGDQTLLDLAAHCGLPEP